MIAALKAEGTDAMTWQSVPVPAQPIFQNKLAYGNGSPWSTSDTQVSYDLDQYPNAFQVLERSFVLRRLVPPNGPDLLDAYVAALAKVFTQLERVADLYSQTGEYIPLETRKARLAPAQ